MKLCLIVFVLACLSSLASTRAAPKYIARYRKLSPASRVTHLRFTQPKRAYYVDEAAADEQEQAGLGDGYPIEQEIASNDEEIETPEGAILDLDANEPADETAIASDATATGTEDTKPPFYRRSRPTYNKQQSAGGSYFPIAFGEASGGAIAISNSYGKARLSRVASHATAYGSHP